MYPKTLFWVYIAVNVYPKMPFWVHIRINMYPKSHFWVHIFYIIAISHPSEVAFFV